MYIEAVRTLPVSEIVRMFNLNVSIVKAIKGIPHENLPKLTHTNQILVNVHEDMLCQLLSQSQQL